MVICIEQWHAKISLLVARSTKGKFTVYNDLNIVNYEVFTLIIMLLLTHGDIESNPEPKHRTSTYFSCCHWNVNSIMAHNKLSLLSAHNTLHKFDVICISETYLDKLLIMLFYQLMVIILSGLITHITRRQLVHVFILKSS